MTPIYVTAAHLRSLHDQLLPLDRVIIETLGTVTYATTRQLEHLSLPEHDSPARARRIRRRLHHLRGLEIIHTLERRVGGNRGGSPQAIHTLDRSGIQLADPDAPRKRLRPARDRGRAHVHHALGVTQHLVNLHTYARAHAGVRVVSWLGEPACHTPYRELGRLAWLSPDALTEVQTPHEHITSMLEVDRGTESLTTLIRKADRYLTYATTRPDCPQIVWSLHDPRRATRLAGGLRHERRRGQAKGLVDRLFVITTREGASAALAGEEMPA